MGRREKNPAGRRPPQPRFGASVGPWGVGAAGAAPPPRPPLVNIDPGTGDASLDVRRMQLYLLGTRQAHARGRDCLEHVIALTGAVLAAAPPQEPARDGLTIVSSLDGGLNVAVADLRAYAQEQLAKGQADGLTGAQVAKALINALTAAGEAACERFGIPHSRLELPDRG